MPRRWEDLPERHRKALLEAFTEGVDLDPEEDDGDDGGFEDTLDDLAQQTVEEYLADHPDLGAELPKATPLERWLKQAYRESLKAKVFEDPPLVAAASKGDLATVKRLLAQPVCEVDVRNYVAHTPLIRAASWGHLEVLDALVEAGADPLATTTPHNETALMWAARGGHVEVMRRLLDLGVGIDLQDRHGDTALHCAAKYSQTAAVELLLERGANPTLRTNPIKVPFDRPISNTPAKVTKDRVLAKRLKEAAEAWKQSHPRKNRSARE